MDWQPVAGILGGAILVGSYVPYIRDMLFGTTRPSLVTQSLWLFIGSIIVIAQFAAGASWSAVLALAATICNCMVVTLIVWGYGYTRYRWWDGVCFVLATSAIAIWYVTADPRLAIVVAITAYTIAVVPTVIKTYNEPYSEHAGAWALVIIAALCGIFAADTYNIANLAFPLYALVEGAVITTIAFFGQRRVRYAAVSAAQ